MAIGALGSLLGVGAQLYGANQQAQASRDNLRLQLEAQRRAQESAQAFTQKGYDTIEGLFGGRDAMTQAYQQDQSAYRNFDPTTQMGQFEYNKTAQDFLDPSREYQQQEIMRAQNAKNFGTGMGLSGSAQLQLQDRLQNQASLGYDSAFSKMTNDRAFNYTDWQNHFNNQVANKSAQYQQLINNINSSKGDMSTLAGAIGGSAQSNANMALNQGNITTQGLQQSGMINNQQMGNTWSAVSSALQNPGLQDAVGQGMSAIGSWFAPQQQSTMDYNQGFSAPTGRTAFNTAPGVYSSPYDTQFTQAQGYNFGDGDL